MNFSVPPSVPQPNASMPAAPTPSWSPANIPRCRTTSAPGAQRDLPFLLDKPFADCAARLRPAAELCAQRGVFSALTLPNRGTELVDLVQQMIDDGSFGDLVLYNSRLNNGPPSRYDPTPSAWHNDATVSGGGCWATESAHGIDTFLQFVGDRPVTAVGGVLSNSMYAREVEDVAVGILRTDNGVTGIVESGYSYPSGARGGDHSFRFIGSKATVLQRYDQQGNRVTEVHTTEGVNFPRGITEYPWNEGNHAEGAGSHRGRTQQLFAECRRCGAHPRAAGRGLRPRPRQSDDERPASIRRARERCSAGGVGGSEPLHTFWQFVQESSYHCLTGFGSK